MSKFSPTYITSTLMNPLKYFFGNYAGNTGLVWTDNDKTRHIEIASVNDFNKIKLGAIPRILVGRGTYQVDKTGLTDNLSSSKSIGELKGLSDRQNKIFIKGSSYIVIEARNEGTCELITDMVTHFLIWTRPFLCDYMGFKEFALPMVVSEPELAEEDTEKFKVTIQIPYMFEEDWRVNEEALKLKGFFTEMTAPTVVTNI